MVTGPNVYGRQTPVHTATQSQPQAYNGSPYSDSTGHVSPGTIPAAPVVPPTPGPAGPTSVDTSSLRKFADNLDTLADMLGTARDRVGQIPDLAAGAFKEAKDLQSAVTGGEPASAPSSSGSSSSASSGSGSGSTPSPPPASTDDSVDGRGGLRGNYHKALHDLRQVLMDTAQNVRTLASKYANIEDINQKAGKDLNQLITTAQKDLQPLMNDQF
ncbi:hypothetical protein K7472_14490 [Streptomyces sp. PTM05]|uniref:Uncharacterized protein n=1 Tax=Streptantibioticus parmotrematis TaxID=2873249 RepID=A0ABS7QS84_9ACTN|nr:hypothetical protein [Streptantibioticus parmotrematis]MBY8886057.1 hypothetical protein [Streptantibioticus parmotrematis]